MPDQIPARSSRLAPCPHPCTDFCACRTRQVDNVVLVGDNAQIIDINSGVCTVGYASHEQLKKLELPKEDLLYNQKVTDAMEQVRD